MQRFRQLSRDQISIDVIGLALVTDADRRDDGDKLVFVQRIDHEWVDAYDLTHHPDIDDLRGLAIVRNRNIHFSREDEATILAAQSHGHAAVLVNQGDDLLVDFAPSTISTMSKVAWSVTRIPRT
jgi:hypothetical protein